MSENNDSPPALNTSELESVVARFQEKLEDINCNDKDIEEVESNLRALEDTAKILCPERRNLFIAEKTVRYQELLKSLQRITESRNLLKSSIKAYDPEALCKAALEKDEILFVQAAARCSRIKVISGSKSRRFPPCIWYQDLKRQIETLFGLELNYICLNNHNEAEDVIGSSVELRYAYEDLRKNESELVLRATFSRKRHDSYSDDIVENFPRKVGPWTATEKLVFKNGILMYGDGAWSNIAKLIGTRDRHQVRSFANRLSSKRYKMTSLSFETAINCCTNADTEI